MGKNQSKLSNSNNLKKALLIGINYIGDPNNQLSGCINDVYNLQKQLNKFCPSCKQFRILTDDSKNPLLKPTKKNIIEGILWLVKDLKAGDNVFLHYSGHGGLIKDLNFDEISGYDSCIYPCNNGKIEYITDDELRKVLVDRIPLNSKCFVVLDCCHSGTGLDLKYNITTPTYGTIIYNQNNKYTDTKGSIIFLSGCQDQQTSADTVDINNLPSGALTNALIDTWNTYGANIKFKYLLWDIRKLLKERGYDQIPQLSSGNNINVADIFYF